MNQAEDHKYGDADLPERGEDTDISSEELRNLTAELSDHLSKISDKKKKQKMETAKNRLNKEADKLAKYEGQEDLLSGRNSYSKTDTDATFMRMKDDRLRAAYNAQISTENQFITNYSISQNPSDTVTFPDHLEKIEQRGETYKPNNYMGDSAYGSEENYSLLADHNIQNYLKYNTFHPEKKKHFKKNKPFHKSNFTYNIQEDCFICPAGKKLTYQKTFQAKSKTGFISDVRVYEFQACRACAFKPQCTKSKNNRQIHYNVKLEKFKAQARTNLDSLYGIALRKRRGPEVETFFGDLRHNCRFNRFLLRGLVNTEHEFGLLAIAHNLRKIAKDALNNVSDSAYITDIFAFLKEFMCFLTQLLKRQKNFHFSQNIRDYSLVYQNF